MPENSTNTRAEPNGFNPKADGAEYAYFDEKTKVLLREAFEAGRRAEADLFRDVLETIVRAVKKYREKTTTDTGETNATKNT